MENTGKQTRGRQKIDMKKIENNGDRLVTFSKRRSGIYKKASELVTMCGAELAVVIFSPSGKPFPYGHPSIESIINKFLERNVDSTSDSRLRAILDAHRRMKMEQQNDGYNKMLELLDAEKGRGKALKQITRATREGNPRNWELGWWEQPLDELTKPELAKVASDMEAFHKNLCNYLIYHPKVLVAHVPTIQKANHEPATIEGKAHSDPLG